MIPLLIKEYNAPFWLFDRQMQASLKYGKGEVKLRKYEEDRRTLAG